MQPINALSVETVAAEPVAEAKNARGLKRKVEDVDDDDIPMLNHRLEGKTTQIKKGRGKPKTRR